MADQQHDVDPDGTPTRLAKQCRRCHGWVVSPESVKAGIGPTCAVKERAEQRAAAAAGRELTLFEILEAEATSSAA